MGAGPSPVRKARPFSQWEGWRLSRFYDYFSSRALVGRGFCFGFCRGCWCLWRGWLEPASLCCSWSPGREVGGGSGDAPHPPIPPTLCGGGVGAGPVQGRMAPRPADRWKQFSVTWGRAELLSRKTGPHVCLQEAAPEPHVWARCSSGLCLFNDAGARGRVFEQRQFLPGYAGRRPPNGSRMWGIPASRALCLSPARGWGEVGCGTEASSISLLLGEMCGPPGGPRPVICVTLRAQRPCSLNQECLCLFRGKDRD